MNTNFEARAGKPSVFPTTAKSLSGVACTTTSPTLSRGQPPLARPIDLWSSYLCPSLSAAQLADRREIADVIDHAILHRASNLDFRQASATALAALPGAAFRLLALQVTCVTLPAGLHALPRCLFRLPALRSIEMATCDAAQIDVTAWDLDTLTITGRTKLRWIAANEATRVSCPAPGIRRKVCVNLYRDGKPIGHTAAGSRRYIKVPVRRPFNMNGKYLMREGEPAYCRHITQWWFGARASRRTEKQRGVPYTAIDMYHVLQSASLFREAIGHDDAILDFDAGAANWIRNILVGDDKFGSVVEQEFRRLSRLGLPATRQFRVTSLTHAMGLELTAKEGASGLPDYCVVFYDPNVSATHLRVKYHRMREVRDLKLSELFPRPELISEYFEKQPPTVILTDLDSAKKNKRRSLRVMLSATEAQCHFALKLAIAHKFEATSIQMLKDLRAMPAGPVDWETLFDPRAAEAFPLLYIAVANRLPRVVRSLLELSIKLSAEGVLDRGAVFQMLQQKDPIGEPRITTLSLACESNDSECIAVVADVLVRPEADGLASPAEYEAFLRNGGPGQRSPFALALLQDDSSAAITMVESMVRLTVAGRISGAQFERLFTCLGSDGISAIEQDFAEGETQVVVALMNPVINAAKATFKPWETARILAAARADGTPALRETYRAGHAGFLAAYGALVLSAVTRDCIHPVNAIAILLAAMPGETQVEALRAIAPHGEMLNTLVDLLHDPIIVRRVSHDLSDGLDALVAEDSANAISSDIDTDSELSSLY
jgi:hypothetical protein